MIELGTEQLLHLTLAVGATAMAAVAGVFLLVVHATRRSRGLGWFWGFAFFAAALAFDAAGQADAPTETIFAYLATACAIVASYFTSVAAFDVKGLSQTPPWALAFIGAFGAAAFAVSFRAGGVQDLLSPELALFPATVLLAVALFPRARDNRRSGVKTVCIISFVLSVLILRTQICAAILALSGRQFTPLYWMWEVIAGVLLAFVLAMGEIVALLDEIRVELEASNAALNRALEGLEVAAKIDPLTGLYNRYAFDTMLEDLRARGSVQGSIAILDLNNLKGINDSCGHHGGDRALLNVALRLKEVVRASDRVFRWGGDEFVVLMLGVSVEVARERVTHMAPPESLEVSGKPVRLTVSFGVAPLRADVEAALREADAQLYAQKRMFKDAGEVAKQ